MKREATPTPDLWIAHRLHQGDYAKSADALKAAANTASHFSWTEEDRQKAISAVSNYFNKEKEAMPQMRKKTAPKKTPPAKAPALVKASRAKAPAKKASAPSKPAPSKPTVVPHVTVTPSSPGGGADSQARSVGGIFPVIRASELFTLAAGARNEEVQAELEKRAMRLLDKELAAQEKFAPWAG